MGFLVPDLTFDRIALCVIILGLLLKYGLRDLIGPKPNKLEKWMIIFLLILTVELLVQFRPKDALVRFLSIFDFFVVPLLAYYITKFLVLRSEKFSQHFIRHFLSVLALAATYMALMAIYEGITLNDLLPGPVNEYTIAHGGGLRQTGGFPRANGPFENPETLGVVLSISFFLVLYKRHIDAKTIRGFTLRKLAFFFISIIILLGLYFNLFRSIWLGLLLGLSVRFFLIRQVRLKMASIALLAILIMALNWSTFTSKDMYQQRLGQSDTFYSRVGAYLYALRAFTESPLIGIGFNRLPKYIEHSMERGDIIFVNDVRPANYAHNTFLSILAENGIIALVPYLLVLWHMLNYTLSYYCRTTEPSEKDWAVTGLSVFIAYVFPLFFDRIGYYGKVNNLFFVVIAIIIARSQLVLNQNKPNPSEVPSTTTEC